MGSFNSFASLGHDLVYRLKSPVASVTFWTYAVIGIVIFGGLAIWIELCKYVFLDPDGKATSDGIRLAVNTYFPAVGCSAAQQLFISEKQRTYLRSFGYFLSVAFMLACLFSFLIQIEHPMWSLWLGIALSVLAILVWWIANGNDPTFQDPDPEGPIGGNTSAPLPGDTKGFSV
jgi:hypothetical protein